jgi:DNA-binding transcriptional MerR regulator
MKMQPVLNDTLTIREMCDLFEVTPRTLRFYESKELLFPIRLGTRRLYTRRDRARMTLIARGKRFGFSLEDIRLILEVYDKTGDVKAQTALAQKMGLERLAAMEAEQAELEARIRELRGQVVFANEMLTACKDGMLA